MTKSARPRITWIDQAKGLGIILVVFGHVIRGLFTAGIVADGPTYRFVGSWIYAFHMPLFFLISGFFAERLAGRAPGAFLREKLATLAYPYFVWSTLQTLMQVAMSRYTTNQVTLADLAGILVQPVMQFWFLYALFVISLIYYGLRRCGLGPLGALAGFVLLWSTQEWAGLNPLSPIHATRNYGIYYALGAVLDRQGWVEKFDRAPAALLALVVALGYGIVAAWVPREQLAVAMQAPELRPVFSLVSRVPLDQIGVPPLALALALSGISATLALAVLLDRARGSEFLRVLGVYSLEIFLAHTMASAAIRIALSKALKVDDVTTHLVLGTVGGIVLPLILTWLCRRSHADFVFRLPRLARPPAPSSEPRQVDSI